MENFDKLFRKFFQGEKSSLSNKQEDLLWDSIVEDLGETNSIPPSNLWSFKIPIILFSIVALSTAAFYFGKYSAEYNQANKNGTSQIPIEQSELNISSIDDNRSSMTNLEVNQIEIQTEQNDITVQELKTLNNNNNNNNNRTDNKANSTYSSERATSKDSKNTFASNTGLENPINSEHASSKNTESNSNNNDFSQNINLQNGQANEAISKSNSNKTKNIDNTKPRSNTSSIAINENNSEAQPTIEKHSTKNNKESSNSFSNESNAPNIEKGTIIQISRVDASKTTKIRDIVNASNINTIYKSDLISTNEIKTNLPTLTKISKKSRNWRFNINPFAGTNYSKFTFSGQDDDLITKLNKYQRSYFGYQAGLNFQAIYLNKWIVESGIQWEETNTIIDQDIDRVISEQKSLITGILLDKQNNVVVQEYITDTTLNRSSKNRVLNINSKQAFIIPLSIGYQIQKKQWIFSLKGGIHGHILMNGSGKSLVDEQSIVNYGNEYFSKSSIGLNINPTIQYSIRRRTRITLEYSYIKRNLNASNAALRIREDSHQLNAGILYRF